MKKHTLMLCFLLVMILLALPGNIFAQSTALSSTFTYQGYLTNASGTVNSLCDFQFGLFDAAAAGTQIGSTLTRTNISVSNGVFNVQLDFGSTAFNGTDRYLDIALRCPAGTGSYIPLTPRQALTPSPYALGLYGLEVQQNVTSPNLIGGFSGNNVTTGVVGATISGGGSTANLNRITDDYGVIGGGVNNQVGNNDATLNNASNATVSGGLNNTASGIFATVGGGYSNMASGNQATVGGGQVNTVSSTNATVGGGAGNTASGNNATIGGGANNTASDIFAIVGGGQNNTASGYAATVGGGSGNTANATVATIAGGNNNLASGDNSTVAGGQSNTASGIYAMVGGGQVNTASGGSSIVGGGYGNTASGASSIVGGGLNNTASGFVAMISGGASNTALGDYSFAAGYRAKSNHTGSFVWADSTLADIASSDINQFIVRASGGVWFGTNSSPTFTGFLNTSTGAYLSNGGTWTNSSDRNKKANFAAVDPQTVLQSVVNLPISSWNYTSQDASIRHIGPMAQDFSAAFAVGEDDKHISTVDADGVALAAIQGLYQTVQAKDTEINNLKARLDALERSSSLSANTLPIWSLPVLLIFVAAQTIGAVIVLRKKIS